MVNMVKIGSGRSQRGEVWDGKGRNVIVEIYVSHGIKVDSLQFLYLEGEYSVLSEKHGGESTINFDVVRLDYGSEFITGINFEYCDDISPRDAISAISFITNRRTYGPFGSSTPNPSAKFRYRVGQNKSFGGFHGSATISYLETIGLYLKPLAIVSFDDYLEQLRIDDDYY